MPYSALTSKVDHETSLFWLRRDLRLDDNAGLYHALKENDQVLCLFIFDTRITEQLEDKDDARITFIHSTLQCLADELEMLGSSLLVVHGDPIEIFNLLNPKAVYTNHDYEPYASYRDELVRNILASKGIPFNTYKDQVIFDRDEIVKDDGSPYTVFTPYSKKWKHKLNGYYSKSYPTANYNKNLKQITPFPFPSLTELGFEKSSITFPQRLIKKSIINTYDKTRNYPGVDGTSKLSVHLRFGTVSIRQLVRLALVKNETWLNELI